MTAEKNLPKCSHCNKQFKYDSERRRHEQSHFPQFQCKVCSKNFSFISALRRHEKQHERVGTVTCDQCGREFRDHMLLKRHTKYAHAGSYTCTKCDTIFYSEPALRTHMQTHKLESERRFQCSFDGCGKKFNFVHHLKHHELTHTNTKQHFCKICGKGFIQSHHLKTHLKTHSVDSSLYCTFPDCNKRFATEYAKKRHVTKYHIKPDNDTSSDLNPAYDMSSLNILKNEVSVDGKGDSGETEIQDTETTANTDYQNNKIIKGIDDEISNCKLALGSCIMSQEGKQCVCTEISKNVNEDYDFTPIEPVTINKLNYNSDCKVDECCGGSCGSNNETILQKDNMPEMEYKTDGTVKIKEFLDIDIPIYNMGQNNNRNVKNDVKFVPYNSCKAVLGKCIVSGNGTIGDGCLCARMLIDEQVTAQEIDDITPQPGEGFPLAI